MYIQLLFCPIRVKAQGLTFFPFVQFNISALGYLYSRRSICIRDLGHTQLFVVIFAVLTMRLCTYSCLETNCTLLIHYQSFFLLQNIMFGLVIWMKKREHLFLFPIRQETFLSFLCTYKDFFF